MNPMFQFLSGGAMPGLENLSQVMQKFQEFQRNFSGNPKAQVESLLQSGQMSQEQFQQLAKTATQFQKLIGR